MTSIAFEIVIIILLVLLNGVLSMSELAVVSARKARLTQRAEDGQVGARSALELAESPNRFLSTVQIGITLVGILAGAFGGATIAGVLDTWLEDVPTLAPYSGAVALTIVVIAIAYLSLVFGELVPKRLALQYPEGIATTMSRPMRLLSVLAAPIVWLLSASTDLVLRILRLKPSSEPSITEDEIAFLLEEGARAGVVTAREHEMVTQIFEVADRSVGDLMTARPRIVWLDINDPDQDHYDKIIQTGHTYFPVCDGTLDNILGIISVKDLWAHSKGGLPRDLRVLLRQPFYVPESIPALELLEQMRKTDQHVALVVDEFGGIEGIFTLNDVIDELAGAATVMRHGEPRIVRRDDRSWLMDGIVPVADVADVLDTPEMVDHAAREYQTLGGFLMTKLDRVPSVADSVEWQGLRFEVVDMDGRRVDKVLVIRDIEAGSATGDEE